MVRSSGAHPREATILDSRYSPPSRMLSVFRVPPSRQSPVGFWYEANHAVRPNLQAFHIALTYITPSMDISVNTARSRRSRESSIRIANSEKMEQNDGRKSHPIHGDTPTFTALQAQLGEYIRSVLCRPRWYRERRRHWSREQETTSSYTMTANKSLLPTAWAGEVTLDRHVSGAHAAAELCRSASQRPPEERMVSRHQPRN